MLPPPVNVKTRRGFDGFYAWMTSSGYGVGWGGVMSTFTLTSSIRARYVAGLGGGFDDANDHVNFKHMCTLRWRVGYGG